MSKIISRPGTRMKWYDGYDANGKRRKFSLRTADSHLAKLRKAEWDQKFLKAPTSSTLEVMTVRGLLTRYLAATASHRTPASQTREVLRAKHLLALVGHRSITDLCPRLIDEALSALLRQSSRRHLASRDKFLKLMRAACRWAVLMGYLDRDPSLGLKPLAPPGQRVYLPVELWPAFLDRAKSSKYYPGVYTLLYTGVRPSEAAQLMVSDFDLDRQLLHIRAEVSKTREERWLALTEVHVQMLREHLPSDGLAFPYYWPRFGRTMTKWLKENFGIIGRVVGSYVLRHGFGTEAGKLYSPKEVQAMMGHRSYQTTMRYLHVEQIAVSAERMKKLGTSGGNSQNGTH